MIPDYFILFCFILFHFPFPLPLPPAFPLCLSLSPSVPSSLLPSLPDALPLEHHTALAYQLEGAPQARQWNENQALETENCHYIRYSNDLFIYLWSDYYNYQKYLKISRTIWLFSNWSGLLGPPGVNPLFFWWEDWSQKMKKIWAHVSFSKFSSHSAAHSYPSWLYSMLSFIFTSLYIWYHSLLKLLILYILHVSKYEHF